MSKAKMFQRAYDAAMNKASNEVVAIRASLDANLEALAVNTFGTPDPATETTFAPPAKQVRVHCLHCDGKYLSGKMRLEYRPRFQGMCIETFGGELAPLWWCKNADCDGAGFGHDLHEIKPALATRQGVAA